MNAPRDAIRLELELTRESAAALLELVDRLGMSDLNWVLARTPSGARLAPEACSMLEPMAPTVDPAAEALGELEHALRLELEAEQAPEVTRG